MLPLAFHLIGAESMEQALFLGYIRQIARLHPGAPLPALHDPTPSCGMPSGCGPGTGTSAFSPG